MVELTVDDIHVTLGDTNVLQGISASVGAGEVVALLGSSGSGKSTLLRSIAGLETPTQGRIALGERVLFDSDNNVNLAPERRELGLVFQSYALWPHKTVYDNVAYGLCLRKTPAGELARRVNEILVGVGLAEYATRFPSQLSGGQQQRVALARALVYRPPLILLDEPLSNLDAKLREEARVWIRDLIKRAGLTAIFVTHDQVEAMAIADRIMLLKDGKMLQQGTPVSLYTSPESLFAADFMGVNNNLPGRIVEVSDEHARLDVDGVRLWGLNRSAKRAGDTATGVVRVERVGVGLAQGTSGTGLAAELTATAYLGGRWEHVFRAGSRQLRALTHSPLVGGRYDLDLPRDSFWIF